MRIVIDMNVLARASRGGTGLAAEVMRLVSVSPHVLIGSPFLLSELARVVRYPRMRKLHGLDDAGIDAYVQAVQSAALMVNLPPGIPTAVVPKDPDDDPIIATAVAGQAEIICTRDRHFWDPDVQQYCAARGIRIMTDVELMQLLRAAGLKTAACRRHLRRDFRASLSRFGPSPAPCSLQTLDAVCVRWQHPILLFLLPLSYGNCHQGASTDARS